MSSYSKNKLSPAVKNKIDTLTELFPDWTPEDLIDLVQEYDDLETIIDKITSGAVTRWDEVKKPSKKERKQQQQYENTSDTYIPQYSHNTSNNISTSHTTSSNITHLDEYDEVNTNHNNTRRSKYNNNNFASTSQRTTKRYSHLPNKQLPLKPVHVHTKFMG